MPASARYPSPPACLLNSIIGVKPTPSPITDRSRADRPDFRAGRLYVRSDRQCGAAGRVRRDQGRRDRHPRAQPGAAEWSEEGSLKSVMPAPILLGVRSAGPLGAGGMGEVYRARGSSARPIGSPRETPLWPLGVRPRSGPRGQTPLWHLGVRPRSGTSGSDPALAPRGQTPLWHLGVRPRSGTWGSAPALAPRGQTPLWPLGGPS